MRLDRWQIIVLGVVVLAVAAAYLIDSIVPIYVLAVLGLPVTAYLLNRTPREPRA